MLDRPIDLGIRVVGHFEVLVWSERNGRCERDYERCNSCALIRLVPKRCFKEIFTRFRSASSPRSPHECSNIDYRGRGGCPIRNIDPAGISGEVVAS